MDRRIFNNPLSSLKVEQLLALLELPTDAQVLDVGCGLYLFRVPDLI